MAIRPGQDFVSTPVNSETLRSRAAGGDPGWVAVHRELVDLHREKARDYGSEEDALANYVETSAAAGEPSEYTCWIRMHEKCVRALNLIRSGRADDNGEGVDVAALAIGAEALRRRRIV